jgi:hypothetical protein
MTVNTWLFALPEILKTHGRVTFSLLSANISKLSETSLKKGRS